MTNHQPRTIDEWKDSVSKWHYRLVYTGLGFQLQYCYSNEWDVSKDVADVLGRRIEELKCALQR